jgi:sugar fermentation stimulation protein A
MLLPPLRRGLIINRYKRFLADVELEDGSVMTVHCPNTGSMRGCWQPGAVVEISDSGNPRRKLPWTLERVDMGQGWIGVNTARTNTVVTEAISEGRVPALDGYASVRREVGTAVEGHPSSRIDLLLSSGNRADAWVEVKNVTLLDGERVCFPDAVSVRAKKHLDVLVAMVRRGERGVILFAVNRPEGRAFSPAGEIDPAYARRLEEVMAAGVEAYALRLRHTVDGIVGGELLPVEIGRTA